MKERKCHSKFIGASLMGAAALSAYIFLLRPWHLRWGATDEELVLPLPGDELVPNAQTCATHAVTINAPVNEVWPWLVQIGRDKGGFYSYSWLENAVGCRLRNADSIVPEWQDLKAGDEVWLHPCVPPLPVLVCEPERVLVLGTNMKEPGTWGFFLKKVDEQTTRLIIRGRGDFGRGLLKRLGLYILFEPAHFIMERKMLLGIKQRVETS